MEGLEALIEQYADENGCISRDSMRKALEANIGSVTEADVDRVMCRLGSAEDQAGSARVSLVEAEAAIKSFRNATTPPEEVDFSQLQLVAELEEAEVRASGAEAALGVSEHQLTQMMAERDQLADELEGLVDLREQQVDSSYIAMDELQMDLQDALKRAERQRKQRQSDGERREERLSKLTEQESQLKYHAEQEQEQSLRYKQLEAKNSTLAHVESENRGLQAAMKEVQRENEFLGTQLSREDQQNTNLNEQLQQYQMLLDDTQTTLQHQRDVVELLNETIQKNAMVSNVLPEHNLAADLASHDLADLASHDSRSSNEMQLVTAAEKDESSSEQGGGARKDLPELADPVQEQAVHEQQAEHEAVAASSEHTKETVAPIDDQTWFMCDECQKAIFPGSYFLECLTQQDYILCQKCHRQMRVACLKQGKKAVGKFAKQKVPKDCQPPSNSLPATSW